MKVAMTASERVAWPCVPHKKVATEASLTVALGASAKVPVYASK